MKNIITKILNKIFPKVKENKCNGRNNCKQNIVKSERRNKWGFMVMNDSYTKNKEDSPFYKPK
jgi:hypothetical protein